MLNTQVQYWANVENERHNRAVEQQAERTLSETTRHDYATESETYRHNTVYENETSRHNVASESLSAATLQETKRHNQAAEAYGVQSLVESSRHNIADESLKRQSLTETQRHNVMSENVQNIQAAASKSQASAAQTRAQADVKKADIESQLLPYNKAKLASETANKSTGALSSLSTAATGIFNLIEGISKFVW